MTFDWITWGIWLTGFIILIVWTIVPIFEFKKLVSDRRKRESQAPDLP